MERLVAIELAGRAAHVRAYGLRPEQPVQSNMGHHHDGQTDEPRAGGARMQLAATLVRQGRVRQL